MNLKDGLHFTNKRLIGGCCAAIGAVLILGYSYSSLHQNPAASHGSVQSSAASASPDAASNTGTAGNTDRGISQAEAYSSRHPALMALSVSEQADKVVERHGSPQSQYVMDDAKDPITVYEYNGFNVGFGADRLLRFVEVKSAVPDPGLGGLRLGQKAEDAVKALGKPDISTDYVLAYQTQNTVLKLDVDPKTKIIQSIKLFAQS
jgi:hypothetical protein